MRKRIVTIRTSMKGQSGCAVNCRRRARRLGNVARGVGVRTLECSRSDALSSARFDAVLTTTAMDEAGATQALAEPDEARSIPQQTQQDRRRIRELERELRSKDRALAETAALLVLSKKLHGNLQHGTNDRPQRSPVASPMMSIPRRRPANGRAWLARRRHRPAHPAAECRQGPRIKP